jgi:hypothetical protein
MLQVGSNLRPSAKSVVSNSEFGLNRRMLANEMEAAAAITALLKEQPVFAQEIASPLLVPILSYRGLMLSPRESQAKLVLVGGIKVFYSVRRLAP